MLTIHFMHWGSRRNFQTPDLRTKCMSCMWNSCRVCSAIVWWDPWIWRRPPSACSNTDQIPVGLLPLLRRFCVVLCTLGYSRCVCLALREPRSLRVLLYNATPARPSSAQTDIDRSCRDACDPKSLGSRRFTFCHGSTAPPIMLFV